MAEIIPVPEVAAGATVVVVGEWLVAPGASFSAGDPLVVIETDKAIVEVEAEQSATLLRALVEPGAEAEVGAPLALLGNVEELSADLDVVLAGLGVTGSDPVAAAPRREVAEAPDEAPPGPAAVSATLPEPVVVADNARRFASPIARRLLREAGVDLADAVGTGPGGRILRRDVEALLKKQAASRSVPASEQTSAAAPVTPALPAGWTEVPHSRLRRAVATRLTKSKTEIPHFYVRRSARIDALLDLRARLNAAPGVKISVNDLIVRAVAVAHRAVPEVNAIWTDDAVRLYEHVDIGVAIASPRGLVTPVLRSVEQSSISTVSARIKELASAAADGRLQQGDLEGGTIAVTNLGMYGVEEFSAIINPPHAAILAVGAGRREAVVGTADDPDAISVATVINLVLSVDHRVVDGALAATWMGELVSALEDPIRVVL